MFLRLLHKVVAQPTVYDLVQKMVGVNYVYSRISKQMPDLDGNTRVLDVGGGTGISFQLLGLNRVSYICVDVDSLKLSGFRAKTSLGKCLLGDASRLPLAPRSIDVAILASVAHHLPDELFSNVVQEIMRVLKLNGRLLLLDPVWWPSNIPGRLIWSVDRGSNPRTETSLRKVLEDHGVIIQSESFTIFHRYLLCTVTGK